MKKLVLLGSVPILIVGIIGGWLLAHQIAPTNFSRATSNVKTFTPYYFPGTPPGNFVLDKDSINFKDNVLVFSMKNTKDSSQTLVFTEQPTPASFDMSSLEGDKEFKTSYGQAFITDGSLRTTGTLFTNDKTWVLINAPNPIGGDTMQTILNALQPTR